MTRGIRRMLAVGPISGAIEPLRRLLGDELPRLEADAIAVVGDLGTAWSKPETYRAVFKTLGEADLPTFWVPGPIDAPISEYLSESHNMEVAFPKLRGIHGTAALGDGQTLFAGLGPAHKGLHEPGSEVVAELIKTHAPRVAIVAGEGATEERLATTLVIAPGRLDLGVYSVIDIHNGSVETGQLAEVAAGRV